jgi:hypothetical protein
VVKPMKPMKLTKFDFLVLIIAVAVVTLPLVLIWSLNTLFGLGIAYTFRTWLAALFLGALVGQRAVRVHG